MLQTDFIQAAAPQNDGPLGVSTRVDTDTFLRLLVEQIRNQDPLNPQDPTQFVSQLAEFSSLEQLLGIRQGIDALTFLTAQPPQPEPDPDPDPDPEPDPKPEPEPEE